MADRGHARGIGAGPHSRSGPGIARRVARSGAGRGQVSGSAAGGGAARKVWSVVYEGASTQRTVRGLRPGVGYLARVRAVNAVGSGIASDAITVETQAAAPEAPRGLSCTQRAANWVRLAWDVPERNNGAIVTSYRVELQGPGSGWDLALVCQDLACRLVGLEPKTHYQIRVSAVNSVGPSQPCEALKIETPLLPPDVPEPPTVALPDGLAEAKTTLPVQLTLTAPEANDRRAAVMSFEVEVREASEASNGTLATAGPGLANGAGSELRVKAGPGGHAQVATERLCPLTCSRSAQISDAALRALVSRGPQAEVPALPCGRLLAARVRCVGADGAGHSGWSRPLVFRIPGAAPSQQPRERRGGAAPAAPKAPAVVLEDEEDDDGDQAGAAPIRRKGSASALPGLRNRPTWAGPKVGGWPLSAFRFPD